MAADADVDEFFVGKTTTTKHMTPEMYLYYREFVQTYKSRCPVTINNDLTYSVEAVHISSPSTDIEWPCRELYITVIRMICILYQLGLACANVDDIYQGIWYIVTRNSYNHKKYTVDTTIIPNFSTVPFCSIEEDTYITAIVELQTKYFGTFEDLNAIGVFVSTARAFTFAQKLQHMSGTPIKRFRLKFPIPTRKDWFEQFKKMILNSSDNENMIAMCMMLMLHPTAESYEICKALVLQMTEGTQCILTRDQIDISVRFGEWSLMNDTNLHMFYHVIMLYLSDADSDAATEHLNSLFVVRD